MKLKFGQINLPKHLVHQVGIPCETFGIPYKFWSNKQAELTKLFKKLLEKWKLVLHLLSLSCLLYSNISMEERNFTGKEFPHFCRQQAKSARTFPQKKDSHNTYEYLCKTCFTYFFKKSYLQPVTKYLRLTLVFMWSSALREKFHFCFSRVFC